MKTLGKWTLAGVLAISGGLAPLATSYAEDVKIGFLMPLTGRYAESGLSTARGVEMVVNRINETGGIKSLDGAKIKLIKADDGSEPTKASIEGRRLITGEEVSFIIGPYSTPEAQAFMPVADRYEVGGLGLQTTIVPTTPYFSTISITAEGFGEAYANIVKWLNDMGANIRTVAITYANNDYGQVVSKTAATALEAAGIEVFDPVPVDIAVKDMTPIVLRVKSMDPDAVISVVYFQDGVLLHKARFNLDYTSPPIWIGGSAGFSDDKLWHTLGDEVADKTLTHSFGLAFYSPDSTLQGLQQAIAEGSDTYPGVVLDQSFMFGVQAANFVARALEEAASTDPKKVNEAFRALRFDVGDPAIVLPIIPGAAHYADNGTLAGTSAVFVQWNDGKKQTVFPDAIASAKPIFDPVKAR